MSDKANERKVEFPRSTLIPNEPLHAPNFRFRPLRSERTVQNDVTHTPGKAMTEPITPALTSEEWTEAVDLTAEEREDEVEPGYVAYRNANLAELYSKTHPHGAAALNLYGQPFGFTWEDVTWLKDDVLANADGGSPEYIAWLLSLIARIEALLPPRET